LGLRGPGARPLSARYDPPSPLEIRRAKAIQRLNNLARGLGLKIEEASHRRVAIVAPIARLEEIIALLTVSASRKRHVKTTCPATSYRAG
jgi:hypothetical protein